MNPNDTTLLADRNARNKFYLFGGLFVAANAICIAFEFYFLLAVPLVLLLLFSVIVSLDKLLLFIVFCTPLSINLENLELGGIGFYFPTEPLLFGVLIIYFIRLLSSGRIEKRVFYHPVTITVLLYLCWLLITTLTSEQPFISFKFLLVKLWFVIGFYFLGVKLFKEKKNIPRFIWLYLIPLIIVVMYTVIRHSTYFFGEKEGHWVMEPFFKDHTSYGAALALLFPAVIGLLFHKKYSVSVKMIISFLATILTIGLVLSYTRAAWVSIVAALSVLVVLWFKIQTRIVVLLCLCVIGIGFYNQDSIIQRLERNKQDSSDDLVEHVQSISNIASDASNLERLNLWNCAFRMVEERPVLGWGPGTFMFNYGAYQHSTETTIISEISGRDVNAHSEYFGPMAESGILGMLLILSIIIAVCITAIKLYKKLPSGETKLMLVIVFLGLITYFVHGTLNSYLDTDKISIPFWGFIAVIVAIDIYHSSPVEHSKIGQLEKE